MNTSNKTFAGQTIKNDNGMVIKYNKDGYIMTIDDESGKTIYTNLMAGQVGDGEQIKYDIKYYDVNGNEIN